MRDRRIMVVGGGSAVTATIVAALTNMRGVVVVAPGQVEPPADEPLPRQMGEALTFPELRDVPHAPSGYGPPTRGKKGKVIRW